LKKYIFLIIAALLVLGLVLPGCGGGGQQEEEEEEEENFVTIAVAGPMTDIQGQGHWNGATMAMDEINAAGGVDIGGTKYTVKLVKVDTKETTAGEDGSTGTANLQAVIDDVDFVVGGFRTEVVSVYREVAMDAQKIFMNCGAATASLQMSVVTNYDKYKYWFKSTPYNEAFLITSCMKMTGTIANVLKGTLATLEATNPAYVKDEFKVSTAVDGKLRAHILMENAQWCAGMVIVAQAYLPTLVGLTVTGTTLVSPTASDITTELNAIKALNPHIIFTAFSGSVGAVYSQNKADLGIPALSIGINVPGQEDIHWGNTDGDCEGEVFLDTYAVGLATTANTVSFFEDYEDRFGSYPVYTAATYDAILSVTLAMEETASLDPEDLIPWLEDNAFTGGTGAVKTAYFPMPDVTITEGQLYALSEDQVRALYPDLGTYSEAAWQCGYLSGSPKGHIAHDTAYGPGYQTGIGAQWQEVDGEGVKVGIWPKNLGPAYDAALTDQWGNWNFQYPGTEKLILPVGNMLNIPWDAYANAV